MLIGYSTEEERGQFLRLAEPADPANQDARRSTSTDIGPRMRYSPRPMSEIRAIYERSLSAMGRGTSEVDVYCAVMSDWYITTSIRYAEAHAASHPNTYMFRFNWRSQEHDGLLGAYHGVATPFWFDNITEDPARAAIVGENPPQDLADAMHRALLAFATTGNPNHSGLPEWPRYDAVRRATMEFNTPSKLTEDPESERRELWTEMAANAPNGWLP
jgi:carboxylesterase type B